MAMLNNQRVPAKTVTLDISTGKFIQTRNPTTKTLLGSPWVLRQTLADRTGDCFFLRTFGGLEHFSFFHILGIIIPTDFHIFQRD
jgi:hypothetical protein